MGFKRKRYASKWILPHGDVLQECLQLREQPHSCLTCPKHRDHWHGQSPILISVLEIALCGEQTMLSP